MARDITRNTNGGVAIQTPSISPELRKVIDKHEVRASFGGDEGTDGGGDFEAGAWIAPKSVSKFVKANAEQCESYYRHWAQPASPAAIVDFLNVVWVGTKHNGDMRWEMIERAYPMLFRNYPAWCFHPDMALPASLKFVWFPAAAELAEFLAERKKWIEDQVWKLRTIATTEITVPERPKEEPRHVPTQAEKDEVSRIVAGIPGTAKHRDPNAAETVKGFRQVGGLIPASPAPTVADAVIDTKAAEDAARERRARKDPALAYTMEFGRRMLLAQAATQAAGGVNPAKYWVPLDQPMHGDERAKHGWPCPGYDPPPPQTAAERHEAAQSRNIRPDTTVVFEDLEEAV